MRYMRNATASFLAGTAYNISRVPRALVGTEAALSEAETWSNRLDLVQVMH